MDGCCLFRTHLRTCGYLIRFHQYRHRCTIGDQEKTPHEKGKELVDKFTVVGLQQRNEGIECALIAVDEILETVVIYDDISQDYQFWIWVKQEIEKL